MMRMFCVVGFFHSCFSLRIRSLSLTYKVRSARFPNLHVKEITGNKKGKKRLFVFVLKFCYIHQTSNYSPTKILI